MMHFLSIISTLFLLYLKVGITASTILDDYMICKENDFSRTLLLCDVDDTLAIHTQKKLILLLDGLQQKVKCKCKKGCERSDGNDKYIGVLLVTNTTKIAGTDESLDEIAKKIYYDAELGNNNCDNGLLIIYVKDKKQLATYHGNDSYTFLDTKDAEKLHNLVTTNKPSDDALSVQHLLSNYDDKQKVNMQRPEFWTPIVGLFLALIIVLLILILLLTLFMARFCCCCAKRRKHNDELYRIGTSGGSKKILIPTPTLDRIYGTRGDAIYSTPYSGTPIPPPHLPGLKTEIYPGSLRSSSQTATPASIKKYRIQPLHSPVLSPSSPLTIGRLNSIKVDDSTQTNGNSSLEDTLLTETKPEPAIYGTTSAKSDDNVLIPRTAEVFGQRPIGHPEIDLSFLDPKRKQEVQTRTDFIY